MGTVTSDNRIVRGSADTSAPVSDRSEIASAPRARPTCQRSPAYWAKVPAPNRGDIPSQH